MGFGDGDDGRRLAEERGARECGREAGARERGEGPTQPGVVGEGWQRERGDKPTERHVGLADPERQSTFGRSEPVHDRPTTRGVDAGAECAGRDEEEHELCEARGDPDTSESNC